MLYTRMTDNLHWSQQKISFPFDLLPAPDRHDEKPAGRRGQAIIMALSAETGFEAKTHTRRGPSSCGTCTSTYRRTKAGVPDGPVASPEHE